MWGLKMSGPYHLILIARINASAKNIGSRQKKLSKYANKGFCFQYLITTNLMVKTEPRPKERFKKDKSFLTLR
jgi:hypothetical protein